jgi:phenylacetate-coenzyme A ligase PaaK-like adenylate-forming protein
LSLAAEAEHPGAEAPADIAELEVRLLAGLPPRFTLPDVLPEPLARVFALLGRAAAGQLDRLQAALADRLVDITVRQAAEQSPFYRDRLEPLLRGDEMVDAAMLAELPLVSRSDVEDAGDSLYSRFASYAFSTYTSGTTSRKPFIVHRSSQEQHYLIEFFHAMGRDAPEREPVLVLALSDWCNGRRLQIPGKGYSFPISLSSEHGFAQAVTLLRRTFPVDGEPRRITAVSGSFNDLMPLTAYLDAEGLKELAAPVRLIQSTAQYQTDSSRAWVERFWECPVDDRFSLSEMFFGARRCVSCGTYHFDHFGLAEAVEPGTGRRLETGRGRLALTAYYPFTQMTPLVRYLSGDLVERVETGCPVAAVGYRFLGRATGSLDLSPELGPGGFLGSGEVLQVTEDIPDLNRTPWEPRFPAAVAGVGAKPFFRLGREGGAPVLQVELRYTAAVFPDRAEEVRSTIERRLAARCPLVEPLLARGTLRIEVVAPGAVGAEPRVDH